jgi:hypothetical protein
MIFLGVGGAPRLGGGVLLAQAVTKSYSFDLSGYPQWLVVLAGTLAAVLVIWILMKLLKWTLWILLFCVLVGGVLWSLSLLLS